MLSSCIWKVDTNGLEWIIHIFRQINDLLFHIQSFVHPIYRIPLLQRICPMLQRICPMLQRWFPHLNNNVQLLELIRCMCLRLQQYVERPTNFLILTVQNLICNTGVFQRMSDLWKIRNNRIIKGPTEVWKGRIMSSVTIFRLWFCRGCWGGIWWTDCTMLKWKHHDDGHFIE